MLFPRVVWEHVHSDKNDNIEAYPHQLGRAKVPGGWLVYTMDPAVALTFVPDPTHSWS